MATIYGDQMVKVRAGRELQANEYHGKGRLIHWDFASLPVGAIGDVLVCGRIRKGERVVWGREFHSAQGGTATGAYGTYAVGSDGTTLGAVDDVDRFQVAVTYVAAGQNDIANTLATFAAWEATADFLLCCTNAASAFATAGNIRGLMWVVSD